MSTPQRNHIFLHELAARRGINKFTAYHWLREHPERLPAAYRLGGRVVFKLDDVEAWESQVQPWRFVGGKDRQAS